MIRIALLGGFQCVCNGQPVDPLPRTRSQTLLAYLALHSTTTLNRRYLAELFWPDSSATQARTNLRRELHHLRQADPAINTALMVDAQHLQWIDTQLELDVDLFRAALKLATDANADSAQRGESLLTAIYLYRGDFLPGVGDEWVVSLRETLRGHYKNALDMYAQWLADQGQIREAVSRLGQLIALDPLDEHAYRHLMELYIKLDEPAHAMHTYHQCCDALERELQTEPSGEILTLYNALRETPGSNPGVPSGQESNRPSAGPIAESSVSVNRHQLIDYQQIPFVGRQQQEERLTDAWRGLKATGMRMMLLTGEAGIGKTRLTHQFVEPLRRAGERVAFACAHQVAQGESYQPLRQWLSSTSASQNLDALPWTTRQQVEDFLAGQGSAPVQNGSGDIGIANEQRNQLFRCLSQAIGATESPLLLVLDNMQWCDLDTVSWLHHCFVAVPTAPVLLIATLRADELGPNHSILSLTKTLQATGQITLLEVPPLTLAHSVEIMTGTLGDTGPGEQRADPKYLFEQSGGNPLFLIEYLRAYLDRNHRSHPDDWLAVPDRVQAVIGHRLDQLDENARHLVNLVAVFDSEFSLEWLLAQSGLRENSVVSALDDLWRRRIFRGTSDGRYDFSHDRIREVAYARIGPVTRTRIHHQIAQSLAARYLQTNAANSRAGLIASHFDRANQLADAVTWYKRAGERAQESSAIHESIRYLDRALILIKQLDDVDLEAETLCQLRHAVITIEGMCSDRIRSIVDRLEDLLPRVKSTRIRVLSLWAMRVYFSAAGYAQRGLECAQQCLIVARKRPDCQVQVQAYALLGFSYWQLGQWTKCLDTFNTGYEIASSDQREESKATPTLGHLQIVAGRGVALAMTGDYYQAQQLADEFWAMPRAHLNRYISGIIDFWIGMLHQLLEDRIRVFTIGERMMQPHETDYPITIASGKMFTGWVLTQQGQLAEGIARMRHGISEIERLQHRLMMSQRLGCVAEAELGSGNHGQALADIQRGIQLAEQTGEQSFLADLYRVRARAIALAGQPEEAVMRDYDKALETAKYQGARLSQWRTLLQLAQHLVSIGNSRDAIPILDDLAGQIDPGAPHPVLAQATAERNAIGR